LIIGGGNRLRNFDADGLALNVHQVANQLQSGASALWRSGFKNLVQCVGNLFGYSGSGVRAQFRNLMHLAGKRAVLNLDLTPKPYLGSPPSPVRPQTRHRERSAAIHDL
jgi:hypothetical protein